MDAHRLSKISGSFNPLTEKEAPAPGWSLFFGVVVVFVVSGEGERGHLVYASTRERDPAMCVCVCVCVCMGVCGCVHENL